MMTANKNVNKSHQLYESLATKKKHKKEDWTLNLLLCALAASLACFLFGFNMNSLALMKPFIIQFYEQNYFPNYFLQNDELTATKLKLNAMITEYEVNETNYFIMQQAFQEEERVYNARESEIKEKYNINEYPIFPRAKKKVEYKRQLLRQTRNQLDAKFETIKETESSINKTLKRLDEDKKIIETATSAAWILTVCFYIIGVCVGAFLSKYIGDEIGRKNGILFQYIWSLVGACLVFSVPILNVQYLSAVLVKLTEFIYGFQSGIGFSLVFSYLNEISPNKIRGEIGMIAPLQFILGIITSQVLGFTSILGKQHLWHIFLSLPVVISIIGVVLFVFFPDSPKSLILDRNNLQSGTKAIKKLRKISNASDYVNEILDERGMGTGFIVLPPSVRTYTKQLKNSWLISFTLHVTVQFSGIYPIIQYSEEIFENVNISAENFQYMYVVMALISCLTIILTFPLIDQCLGRKFLLVTSTLLIIIDLILLIVFSALKNTHWIYNYLNLGCLVAFIICFSFGLGPIPFIYVTECFKHESRTSVVAFCVFINGVSALSIFLMFPLLRKLIDYYLFIFFIILLIMSLIFIIIRLPETKQKSIKEIKSRFQELSVYRF